MYSNHPQSIMVLFMCRVAGGAFIFTSDSLEEQIWINLTMWIVRIAQKSFNRRRRRWWHDLHYCTSLQMIIYLGAIMRVRRILWRPMRQRMPHKANAPHCTIHDYLFVLSLSFSFTKTREMDWLEIVDFALKAPDSFLCQISLNGIIMKRPRCARALSFSLSLRYDHRLSHRTVYTHEHKQIRSVIYFVFILSLF